MGWKAGRALNCPARSAMRCSTVSVGGGAAGIPGSVVAVGGFTEKRGRGAASTSGGGTGIGPGPGGGAKVRAAGLAARRLDSCGPMRPTKFEGSGATSAAGMRLAGGELVSAALSTVRTAPPPRIRTLAGGGWTRCPAWPEPGAVNIPRCVASGRACSESVLNRPRTAYLLSCRSCSRRARGPRRWLHPGP